MSKVHRSPHQRNKSAPMSTHQVPISPRESSLRLPSFLNVNRHESRHVTFNTQPHPAFRPRSRSMSTKANALLPIDGRISDLGGTTSTLECLPHRLRISKTTERVTPHQSIEELTRETGYLREELAYHKEARDAYLKFFEITQQAQRDLHNAIAEVSRRVAISEQRLEDYWKTQAIKDACEEHLVF